MPLRVCLVALNAYPAIDPEIPGPIGGIETRAWTLARGLARQPGLDVSLAIRHSQALRRTNYEGVHLHLLRDRLYRPRESLALRLQRTSGFPWLTLRAPRWSDAVYLPLVALQRAARGRADPLTPQKFYQQLPVDLFVTFGVQQNSASVIASAHSMGRPAVLFLSWDGDLDERYLSDENFVSEYHDSASICRWTIQHADRILCQTEAQQARLKLFGREATLLRNPLDFESWDTGMQVPLSEETTAGLKRYALWIGRADTSHKRPLLLNELARRCPDVDFLMVLNRRDDAVEREVRQTAPANVRITERVPFTSMPGVLRRAAVLVNTSSREGFPNAYLQAAATGVPIGSLNVEQQFLEESHAGFCAAGDLDVLATFIRDCWRQTPISFDAHAARMFIEARYALAPQSRQLAEFLQEVASELAPHKNG